ncbi:ABC transporter permease [Chloroflexia bacterium SDU3-3]|nr:ABC transporter permease [Chloroflexia bacterium SDU3-3]
MRYGWGRLLQRQELFVALVLLGIGVALSLSTSTFFTNANLLNVALGLSWYVIAAFGAAIVIIVGGIDLSVGSTIALSGMVCAMALQQGLGVPAALLLGLLSGAAIGLANGLLVGHTRLPPFMVTLGTMGITRGLVLSLTGGAPVSRLPAPFLFLGQGELTLGWLAVPLPIVWMLLVAVAVSVLFHQTVLGRYIFTIGRDERAMLAAGISPAHLKTVAYTISGMLAALAGLVMVARLGVAAPMAAYGYELDIIAAAVIGGASLFGGEGSVTGVILGAALIQIMRNGVVLLGLPNQNQWQFVSIGGMVLLVLLLDFWRRRRA